MKRNGKLSAFIFCPIILSTVFFAAGCQTVITRKYGPLHRQAEAYLEKGEELFNRRRYREALIYLEEAAVKYPFLPEAPFLKGLALFHTDEYGAALGVFRQTIKNFPDFYPAYEWAWAAELELNQSNKAIAAAVRGKIEAALSAKGDRPGLLLSAYLGYRYLDEREKGRAVLYKLLDKIEQGAGGKKVLEETAAQLLEEAIAEKDDRERLRLAERYVRLFPGGRNIDLASRLLFHAIGAGLDDEGLLREYIDKYSDCQNIYLYRSIAEWLIKKNWDTKKAVNLLGACARFLERPELQQKPPHMAYGQWEETLAGFKAECFFLIGLAFFKSQNHHVAKSYLKVSNNLSNDNPRLYHYLGEIAGGEGRYEQAVFFFKKALETGPHKEKSAERLRGLLKDIYGYHGDPRGYFAPREGVTTFRDSAEILGLEGVRASSASWGDYDGDGFLDLLVNGHRLFRNEGGRSFREVTKEAGLTGLDDIGSGYWGDYNNDTRPDLYLIGHGANRLLENNGRGGFRDVSAQAFAESPRQPTESAAWGDIDKDGFLDLYVANHERPGIMNGLGTRDRLYRNTGRGSFKEITREAGLITEEEMCGRHALFADFNRDGLPDIFVSNYRLDPNFLWLNRGDGRFREGGEEKGVRGRETLGSYGNTIASAAADFNGDGAMDLFCANLAHPRYIEFSQKSTLFLNQGPPDFTFNDRAPSGIPFEETSAYPAAADIDNDGDPDLFVASVYPGRYSRLYLNDGAGHFRDITWLAGVRVENSARAAFADFDNDGDMDLAVCSAAGLRLFQNNLLPLARPR